MGGRESGGGVEGWERGRREGLHNWGFIRDRATNLRLSCSTVKHRYSNSLKRGHLMY